MTKNPGRGCPPRIIWILWLQGWDHAPAVAWAARISWERRNPGWTLQILDQTNLAGFLPSLILDHILAVSKPPEALSDQIRLELLHRYGGVWADATTICTRPLDDWLPAAMPNGFFAFSRPGPDRMISTWFLAAEKGSLILERWRAAAWAYWKDRTERDSYFWNHDLFALVYARDAGVRAMWDGTPEISAQHAFHFSPESENLKRRPGPHVEAALANPPVPVFKLTHKFARPPGPESLFARLCDFATDAPAAASPAQRPLRILVGWYGSFPGHGTIGDLRSLEAVVTHLVGLGFDVVHATSSSLSVPGAARVDWTEASADVVIFVCGPVLKTHSQTRSFFEHFADSILVGVSVSLMPEESADHCNPFRKVFARQGGPEAFGDVAIVAPMPPDRPDPPNPTAVPVIGLALRGPQQEYGPSLCKAETAAALFSGLTDLVVQRGPLRVVMLEDHLQKAALDPDAIEANYAACNLVLTTRFHGAIMALRGRIPFIAVDQITGGAKVWPLLAGLGWHGLFQVDKVEVSDILSLGTAFLAEDKTLELSAAQSLAVREANRTLDHLGGWLSELGRSGMIQDGQPGENA